jgi:homocitrate synthase NifV
VSGGVPGLVDSTLREGLQAPVAYLTKAQQRAVLASVLRIGVEEVELGHAVTEPAYRPEPLADLIELAARLRPGVRRAIWCRARADDIEAAAALGPDVVSFAVPVSDLHLTTRLRKSRGWALDEVGRLVALARAAGVGYVSVGLEDATRADPGHLDRVVAAADAAGADRVRIADTVGVTEPGELVRLVERVRAGFRGEVGVHVHDDFGMATAGAVAALAAGADWADVSLTGLGERAGISRTEEVAAWLVARRGAGYDLVAAREAARCLTTWVGRVVPSHAPVIGSEVFACESGLHLAGLAADPATYEPYPPELVGAERIWRLGRGSGRAAVAALAPDATDLTTDLTEAAAMVRRAAGLHSRALHPAELAECLQPITRG